MDPADFDQEALFSAFASLASVDPESFISISRAENTFTTELSASDLLRDPNFSDALVQLLVASAIEPEADDELLTGATLVTDQLAAALEGSTFSLAQQIDPDTQLVQQSTLTLDASVDLAAIEAGTGTVDFSFVTDVTLSDYGQPAGLTVPESVTPIPSSIILDAFGVAATEDTQPEALPTASASDETTTEVTTEAGSIGVGETVTVTVPQGGVSQLSIESSETVTITARALGDADTTLTLLDANGVQIAFNDDNGGGFPNLDSLDSAIQRVSLPGSATIEVGEFGSDGGQVEVSVTAAEEIENPSSIGVGETTTVTIPSGGNALFDLETDETVTITVRSLGEADPTLTLLDGSGSEIGYNDDFSGDFPELSSLDSAISRVSIPGSATIQVGEFGDDGGQVEVSVMAAEPIENPSSIGVGEITTVTIPSGGTVPLTLETDGAVTITLRALGGADTTLTVLGPDGAEIAYNDDNSGDFPDLGTFDSAVSNVKIPGSATIEVGEYGDGGGDVEVTVTASGSVSVAPSDAQAVELTCGTAPQEFEGDVGTTFTGTCPSGCGDSSVWGTGDYTDDSGVCTAAIHAGAVGTGGGSVTFTITPGLEEYTGSTQNGITTSDWGSWGRSFSFDG